MLIYDAADCLKLTSIPERPVRSRHILLLDLRLITKIAGSR